MVLRGLFCIVHWARVYIGQGMVTAKNAYAFEFGGVDGGDLPLARYRGRAMLVVNTASRCAFTPQYAGLQDLWRRYESRGLVVVGVPSVDFGGQELASDQEVAEFCSGRFGVTFPLTTRSKVRGRDAHPFYRWAISELGAGARPRWNFHKYLIAPDGSLVDWFASITGARARRMIKAIERVLPHT